MARPREFDMDTALADAMDVFWAYGYEDTSLPQLLEGMSLSRGSLYKAFNDKRSLFITVLDRYEKEAVLPALEVLKDQNISDGAERIQKIFQSVLDAASNGDHRGCLLCTAAAGSAPNDKEIAQIVHRLLDDMRGGFKVALEQSKSPNARDGDKIDTLAAMLLAQYVGLRILVRSKAPPHLLNEAVGSVKLILGK